MRILTILTLFVFATAIAMRAQTDPKPQYVITVTRGSTPLGQIVLELYPDVAPKHVRNFDSLVSVGFYEHTAFHRVIPKFVVQGGGFYSNKDGEPKESWGYSDDSQARIPAEFSTLKHLRGIVSMARLGNDINSATSQFFICVADLPSLDGKYSIFGHVIEGMDVVDTIVNSPRDASDSPLEKIEMSVVARASASAGRQAQGGSEANTLAVRPSISNGEIHFTYTTSKPDNVSLSIHDISGRDIQHITNGQQEPGTHTAFFDGTTLPSGTYIARLRAGSTVTTTRFIITR